MNNTETQTATSTYTIPVSNLDEFFARMDVLNKRARKIGCPEIQVTMDGPVITIPAGERFRSRKSNHDRYYQNVKVVGESPRIPGWTFIGVISHNSISAKNEDGTSRLDIINILRSVPGNELPQAYTTAVPSCDHCGKVRWRTETFVFTSEDGNHIRVGRQCMRDFFGHTNPDDIAWLCCLEEICRDSEKEESEESEERIPHSDRIYIGEILEMSVAVIREIGWISSSVGRDTGKSCTRDHVMYQLQTSNSRSKDLITPTQEDKENAKAALEWVRQTVPVLLKEKYNEYLWNLMASCAHDVARMKDTGIICSVISAWQRWLGNEIKKKVAQKNPAVDYIGKVGDKIKGHKVTVVLAKVLEGAYYGRTYQPRTLVRMVDDNGNAIVWWATGSFDNLMGRTLLVSGTVKATEVYEGEKQTTLTRCKFAEIQ